MKISNFYSVHCFFFLLIASFSQAQDSLQTTPACGDIITFYNETTQKAKILEITPTEIVFKRCANFNGPTIRMNKNNIKFIVYANGMKESFEKVPVQQPSYQTPAQNVVVGGPVDLAEMKRMVVDTTFPVTKVFPFDYTRHFISVDVLSGLVVGVPTLSYEYILNTGKISVKGSLGFGTRTQRVNDYQGYTRRTTKQSYAIDLNFYLFEGNFYPGDVRPFIAPSIEYGVFNYAHSETHNEKGDSVFAGNPPVFQYTNDRSITNTTVVEGYYTLIMLKAGFLYRPAKHFNISFVAGLGALSFNSAYRRDHYNKGLAKIEVFLGYKF